MALTVSGFKDQLGDDGYWAVVRVNGEPILMTVPPDFGPAMLLVSEVTDALKNVSPEGLVDESLDRGQVWAVEGFALNRVVIARLADEAITPLGLYEAVTGLGLGWQVSQMPSSD